VKRALPPMSRRSARCWDTPIDSSRCMITDLGLLMPIERKSVEPMAALTAPAQVAAKHQSLLHFVGNARWSDAAMLDKSLPSRKRGCASWCCR
jgi:DDE superfamily endonuclease